MSGESGRSAGVPAGRRIIAGWKPVLLFCALALPPLALAQPERGSVVSSMIEKETGTTVVVRTITDTVNVPKSDITERQTTPQSLMPPGLLEALPEHEALELLKFLTTAAGAK